MELKLTRRGKALLLLAMAGDVQINFKALQFGNGVYAGEDAEALSNPLLTTEFSRFAVADNFVTLTSIFSNSEVTAGFRATELGVLADDPDNAGQTLLYAYGYTQDAQADYIPSNTDEVLETQVDVLVYVGSTENVTAAISQSAVYVSKAEFEDFVARKDNPHNVNAEQVGLGNVPNVRTNDQTPTYTLASTLTAMVSGEKLGIAFGKVARAVSSLIAHLSTTGKNVHNETPESIGAASSDHRHSATDITSGILGTARGGLGNTDGRAASADRLSNTNAIGSATTPVYFTDGGVPTPCDEIPAMAGATTTAAGTMGLVPAPAAGAATRYLRSDGTWAVPPDTNTTYSAATTSAAGLMSAADKTKLDGIAAGANAYTHPTYTARASGLYKVTVDGTGHVSAATAAAKADITALGIPAQDTTYAAMAGATTTAAGTMGLVPAPAAGAATRYLRSDGTWAVPPDTNTTYSTMTGATSSADGKSGLVPTPAAGGQANFLRGDGTWCGYITAGQSAGSTLGDYATAEGFEVTASGLDAHAEGGYTEATGDMSHAEGYSTVASGHYSHAEGYCNIAAGYYSHAGGYDSTADYAACFAHGYCVSTYGGSTGQFVIGKRNVVGTSMNDIFVIGCGTSSANSNCFRVTTTSGVYANAAYSSTGADYAEYFEWSDSNPLSEDRVGRFVTLDGDKIRLATSDDEYILGIVSGAPSVAGDAYDDQWKGMYLQDVFGRPVMEEVEVPDEVDEAGNIIIPAHTEIQRKLNPAYDKSQKYIPRSERPEWATVGMMGKLVVIDDGTCQTNGFCRPGTDGIATSARDGYRVLSRIDATHIRVLMR